VRRRCLRGGGKEAAEARLELVVAKEAAVASKHTL
jgi:hypothetical protein